MTDIDSNEHRSHGIHDVWELHLVEVASHLAIDLLQDVGSF